MVPVFTHEQLEMAIQKNKGGAIAFYSEEYFLRLLLIKSKKSNWKEKDVLTAKLEGLDPNQKKAESFL